MNTHLLSRPGTARFRWTVVVAVALASSLSACDKSRETAPTGTTSANPPASAASR